MRVFIQGFGLAFLALSTHALPQVISPSSTSASASASASATPTLPDLSILPTSLPVLPTNVVNVPPSDIPNLPTPSDLPDGLGNGMSDGDQKQLKDCLTKLRVTECFPFETLESTNYTDPTLEANMTQQWNQQYCSQSCVTSIQGITLDSINSTCQFDQSNANTTNITQILTFLPQVHTILCTKQDDKLCFLDTNFDLAQYGVTIDSNMTDLTSKVPQDKLCTPCMTQLVKQSDSMRDSIMSLAKSLTGSDDIGLPELTYDSYSKQCGTKLSTKASTATSLTGSIFISSLLVIMALLC